MITQVAKIYGAGFMSFKDNFSFDISDFEGQTLQIDGNNEDDSLSKSNGAGKSTILEIISWILHGEICRKNRYKDEVINKESKEAIINANILIGKDGYVIRRHISRKKENDLVIHKNGIEIMEETTPQVKQEELEKILGMNFKSFLCSTLFGRDFMSFPDLKPSERSKTLSDLRGLEKYNEAGKKANDLAKSTKSTALSVEERLKVEEGKLTGIRLTTFKEKMEGFEKTREKQIENMEESVNVATIKLGELASEREEKEGEIRILIDQGKKELEEVEIKLKEKKILEAQIQEINIKKAGSSTNLNNIQVRKNEKLAKIKKLQSTKIGPCPTCGQPITGDHLIQEINRITQEIIPLDEEETTLQLEISSLNEKRNNLNKLLTILLPLENMKAELTHQRMAREKNLIFIQKSSDEDVLKREIRLAKQRTLEIREEINPYIQLEENRKNQIKEIGVTIRSLIEQINILLNTFKYYDVLASSFKEIRWALFDTMITDLQNSAQHFMIKYSSELQILMSTTRETRSGTIKDEFNISVVDSDGIEISYEMYSGGEKQKVKLSVARALSQMIKDKCGREYNFAAFDEPNDGLDDIGKETNFNLFTELAEEGKAVLVTDHDANFKDRFQRSMVITKKNKKSRIDYER